MLFVIREADHAPGRRRELRRWLFANGVPHPQLADPVLVDSVAQTLTVSTFVPVPGQESLDLPQFLVDAHGEPVTVEHVLDLAVMPLSWMLTKRGAWTGPGSTQPQSLLGPARALREEGSPSRPGVPRHHARQASIAL